MSPNQKRGAKTSSPLANYCLAKPIHKSINPIPIPRDDGGMPAVCLDRSLYKLITQSELLEKKAQATLNNHRRAARKLGIELDYSRSQLVELLAGAKQCAYCRMPLGLDLEIDHAEPLARGKRACRFDNLRCVCHRCNATKGVLTEDEFRDLLTFLRSLDPRSETDIRRRLQAGAAPIYRRKKR